MRLSDFNLNKKFTYLKTLPMSFLSNVHYRTSMCFVKQFVELELVSNVVSVFDLESRFSISVVRDL